MKKKMFTLEFTKEEIDILANLLDTIILGAQHDFDSLDAKETHERLLEKWAKITGKSYK